MLVIPAANAITERSFSSLKWIKIYLHSTTGEARLNHLMLLHVDKDVADGIDIVEATNLFVETTMQALFETVFTILPSDEVCVCL